ncbi:MAG: C4-dicarboxylate ABC transporter substrate-binding protein [Verrucomicrobia bacterium]|nr:MAG: C4-dicarboxylate ABC transporter substrate-binding protein [Verrucomicrobiota bacterium]
MSQEQNRGEQGRYETGTKGGHDGGGAAGQPASKPPRPLAMIMEVFGLSRTVTIMAVLFVAIVVTAAIFFFVLSAPPTTITITSGPEGSGFHTNGLRYAAILARYGIQARVLTSHGSLENIERLLVPKKKERPSGGQSETEWADIGLVQSGVKHEGMEKLVSLGSVASQPLMVFYRGTPIEVLSELAGKRLAVGAPGSGTRALALTLLATNGIDTRPRDHKTTDHKTADHRTTDHRTPEQQDKKTTNYEGAPGEGTRPTATTDDKTMTDHGGTEPVARASNLAPGPSTLLDWEPRESYKALLAGKIDAAFLMGEDASGAMMRELLRAPDIHLFSFKQAAAYTRRFSELSVLDLPEGSIDLGKDIPPQTIHLIGPTVELAARPTLHPVLSDLMLEAAKEVHGRATLLQNRNQFPAAIEHDLPISADAARWYKSGRSFFYRYLPFWLASVVRRVVVVFVPAIVVMVPILRSLPRLYQWRIRSRLYPWYRALLAVEGELFREERRGTRDEGGEVQGSKFKVQSLRPEDRSPKSGEGVHSPQSTVHGAARERLLGRLDEIESGVNRIKIPASFADQFYGLREHIDFVRELVEERTSPKS